MGSRRAAVFFVLAVLASSALLVSAAADKPKKKGIPTKAFVTEDGQHWTVHKSGDEKGRAFFYHVESGKTQWTDPRVQPLSSGQRTLVMVLFISPFVLMIGGAAAYIMWIRSNHPELLKGPKKVKGLKNWERALIPPKVNKPKVRASSPTPEEARKPEEAKKEQ